MGKFRSEVIKNVIVSSLSYLVILGNINGGKGRV